MNPTPRQPVLFGAFDRHNLGDLLFGHLEPAWPAGSPTPIRAGIVAADLRPFGGHDVVALAALRDDRPAMPLHLVHAGGEILGCERTAAWITTRATDDEAARAIAWLQRDPMAFGAWLQAQRGFASPAPYVIRRAELPPGSRVEFRAVGGVGLASLEASLQRHVLAALAEADRVTVRDAETRDALAKKGIVARLEADPAAQVRARFGLRIAPRTDEVMRGIGIDRAGGAYLAVQAGGEFADDRSLDMLAQAIRATARGFKLPVVMFRAGAAPWHDDPHMLSRLAQRLRDVDARMFDSLDIWSLCALIAGARAVVGSSLHVRIVAEAFARPALSLLGDDAEPNAQANKVRAYVGTWFGAAPRLATLAQLGDELDRVLRDSA